MGKIILVSLPIGNLKDLTARAQEVLALETNFFAEDTRVFKSLLSELGIQYAEKLIDSFHDHTEGKMTKIASIIESGKNVVMVSDAGSPVISDPAYPILKWAKANSVEVDSVPGVTSVVVALELSLFPAIPFTFWGFFPRSDKDKKDLLEKSIGLGGTHIYFESPHRIIETLHHIKKCFPEAEVALMRELTKKFQSVYRFKANDFNEEDIMVKGEFVIVLYAPVTGESLSSSELKSMVDEYLNTKSSAKQLAKIFSKITGENSSDIYDRLNRHGKS